jgi:asparagine synthase (glutamine-hydrolysing)
MCGIAGYFGLSLADDERLPLLHRMCGAITHRGPDDDGYHADDMVGLGMRRLSIIDLERGHQPISSVDSKRHIIFNGEIYNYQELREQLQKKGHVFLTASDTEVILRQYEQDGPACVHHFNGMFAFAIWDQNNRSLFLARDRMGVKPLYYFWDGSHFLFASEVKALLASGYIRRELNLQAMWDYLTFRYVPQPETIWRNVYKLLPGHTLAISMDQRGPHICRYWEIPYTDHEPKRDESELNQEFGTLFLDSVRLRLIADVPVGILLSGGLDSSSVAAAVAEQHNARLSSFSVAFQDSPAIDELPFARQVAERIGTDHNEIVIGQREFCDFLPYFVHYTDEPMADLASIPLYYVSRLAREKVKVVLSGEGSDEILGGYDFDLWVREMDRRRSFQRLPRWLRHDAILAIMARLLGGRFVENFAIDNTPTDLRLLPNPLNMTNYLTSEAKQTLFVEHMPYEDSMNRVRSEVMSVQCSDPLHQRLYIFCQSWLVEDLLMKADRMSMANSIELRTPFLDYRLVEWAARSPSKIKVGKNRDGKYETKRVLRQFTRGRLPAEIIQRSKMGFPVPVYDWLSDRLKSWATDLLTSKDTQIFRWLNPAAVYQQLQLATSPNSPLLDRHRLWNLLILELWSREWQPA